ncbi:MAG: hypothetical protein NTZ61_00425, partial [Proteobacteria bacterium]|nr:hypothetical protein [Pseudomonadota bacterium]
MSNRIVDAAPEVEKTLGVTVLLGDLLDRSLALQTFFDACWQAHEIGDQRMRSIVIDQPAAPRQVETEQIENGQLGRKRLGAGNGDLWSRMRVDDGVRSSSNTRIDSIAYRKHLGATLVRRFDRGQRIGG